MKSSSYFLLLIVAGCHSNSSDPSAPTHAGTSPTYQQFHQDVEVQRREQSAPQPVERSYPPRSAAPNNAK